MNKVNVLEWLSQSPDLNPNKLLWKDLSKQFIGGNPLTSQSLIGSALRKGLKLIHVIVQDRSAFTRNVTFRYCSKRGSDTESKDSHSFATHRYVTLGHFFFESVLFVYFQDLFENLMMFWVIFMQIYIK